jgi:hypothetical protein
VTPEEIFRAAGEALGAMVKQGAAETLRSNAKKKAERATAIKREILRLKVLANKAASYVSRGRIDKAIEHLFTEVASWEDSEEEWTDSEEIQQIRGMVIDTLTDLIEEEDQDEDDEDGEDQELEEDDDGPFDD